MNGKPKDMDYKFAIKVLQSAKVDTPSMHGNPKRYGYQNQTFYDIARNMAIQALKERHESPSKPQGEWIIGKYSTQWVCVCSKCRGRTDVDRNTDMETEYPHCPKCGTKLTVKKE